MTSQYLINKRVKFVKDHWFKYPTTDHMKVALQEQFKCKITRNQIYNYLGKARDKLEKENIFKDDHGPLDDLLNTAVEDLKQLKLKAHEIQDKCDQDQSSDKFDQAKWERYKYGIYLQIKAQNHVIHLLERAGKIIPKSEVAVSVDPELFHLLNKIIFLKAIEVIPEKYWETVAGNMKQIEGKTREELKLLADTFTVTVSDEADGE